jgi:3D (Asp-Asp-Asp) domain-containing protein
MNRFIQVGFLPLFLMIFVLSAASLHNLVTQQRKLNESVERILQIQESKFQIVTLTAYHPASRGLNSDSNPDKTATMRKPIPGRTAAISRELLALGWLGKIYIKDYGVWETTDLMGESVKGKQIDLCFPSRKEALKFGKKEEVFAVFLD